MKKIINGKVYNSDCGVLLAKHRNTSLMRTKAGNHFFYDHKAETITPIQYDEAKAFMEKFPNSKVEKPAYSRPLTLHLASDVREQLSYIRNVESSTFTSIISELITNHYNELINK